MDPVEHFTWVLAMTIAWTAVVACALAILGETVFFVVDGLGQLLLWWAGS